MSHHDVLMGFCALTAMEADKSAGPLTVCYNARTGAVSAWTWLRGGAVTLRESELEVLAEGR